MDTRVYGVSPKMSQNFETLNVEKSKNDGQRLTFFNSEKDHFSEISIFDQILIFDQISTFDQIWIFDQISIFDLISIIDRI